MCITEPTYLDFIFLSEQGFLGLKGLKGLGFLKNEKTDHKGRWCNIYL